MSENHTETIVIEKSSGALMGKLKDTGAQSITYLARITDYRQSKQNVLYGGADVLFTPARPPILIVEMTAARIRELLKNSPKKEDEYDIELTIGRPLDIPKARSLVYVECDNNKIGLSPWPKVPLTAQETELIRNDVDTLLEGYKED